MRTARQWWGVWEDSQTGITSGSALSVGSGGVGGDKCQR